MHVIFSAFTSEFKFRRRHVNPSTIKKIFKHISESIKSIFGLVMACADRIQSERDMRSAGWRSLGGEKNV
jgi:hypothetical protein